MIKSTLALIVLFGVPYITFAFMPDNEIPFTRLNLIKWHKALIIKLYFEFSFQVIQALAIVALFAFGNKEVQDELAHLARRIRYRVVGGDAPSRTSSSLFRSRASTASKVFNQTNENTCDNVHSLNLSHQYSEPGESSSDGSKLEPLPTLPTSLCLF